MLCVEDVRRLALGLPEATEEDHHGRPSFRVANRIFATLWTPHALNVMAGEELIRAAVERSPESCSEVHWGRRLAAVRIDLRAADPGTVEDLLYAAWSRRAPRRLNTEPPPGRARVAGRSRPRRSAGDRPAAT
jgi:hypothetical protein